MAIAASVSVAAIAQAEDYQVEGGLAIMDPDNPLADNTITIDGRYHVETVSTDGTVLNEAAFVGRNSNIHAEFWDADTGGDGSTIGVEWWFENIYAALAADDNNGFSNTHIEGGYMVGENTLVALGMVTGDVLEDIISLRAKHVGELGDNTVNLEAKITDDSVNSDFMVGGDFYFSETLSAGLDFSDGDSFVDPLLAVNVKNFFTPKISGELTFYDNGTTNPIEVRAAMRF